MILTIDQSTSITYDTDDLVEMFGVPNGKIIVIDGIIFSAGGAVTLLVDVMFDIGNVDTGINSPELNTVRLQSATEDDTKQVLFPNGVPVRNNMRLHFHTGVGNFTFQFRYEGGEMDWKAEQAEVIPDIKRISSRETKSAGQEFFQAGSLHQVGEPD
jgi:hypothetical protein